MKPRLMQVRKRRYFSRIKKGLMMILGALGGAYALAVVGAFLFQDALIFHPQPLNSIAVFNKMRQNANIELTEIKTKDNVSLKGWFVKSAQKESKKVLFYFGGNAEEVSNTMMGNAGRLKEWSFIFFNYRGYGESGGKPGEKNIYTDSLEIYDTFHKKLALSSSKVVFMGRSLGSGVATYLAANRRADGVILATPYDSMESVARETYPILPVKYMLRHKFNSMERAPGIKLPVLMLVASEDTVIPPWHARDLANKWGGEVTFKEMNGVDHDSIVTSDLYWEHIGEFLSRFKP